MSRLSRVLLALLVPAELLLALALLLPRVGASSEAEMLVRAYLQRQGVAVPSDSAVQQLVRASRPWNLTPGMSRATFGSSAHYQTSQGWSLAPTSAVPPASTPAAGILPRPGVRPSRGQGLRPLPYPPMEVWCVRLQPTGTTLPGLLWVARHQDLHNADWILHEPAALSAEALADELRSLGCDLGVGRE